MEKSWIKYWKYYLMNPTWNLKTHLPRAVYHPLTSLGSPNSVLESFGSSIGKTTYWQCFTISGITFYPEIRIGQTRYHSKQDLETFNLIGNGPHNSFWSNRFHHFKLNLQIVTKKSAPCLSNIFVLNHGCAKCTRWLAKFTLGSLFVPMSSLKGWLLGDGWFR